LLSCYPNGRLCMEIDDFSLLEGVEWLSLLTVQALQASVS
jgi:hypothetical protein